MDEEKIATIAEEYYKELFTASNSLDMEEVINSMEKGSDRGHGPRLASPLHRGRSKNSTLPNAPIQSTGSRWYVTHLFSKILAYCRA